MTQSAIRPILGLTLSYLLGSIPTAYLFGRARGIDLRRHGSGNIGATNAFRVLGKGIGAIVLSLDVAKGTFAILLAAAFFYTPGTLSKNFFLALAAIAVVAGHNWTPFLRFGGGKGIATSLGVLIALCLLIERFTWVIVSVLATWIAVFLASGFVSLASICASLTLPLLSIIFRLPKEIALLLLLLAVFSLIRHKPNISRLLQQKESRFDTRSFLRKLTRKTLSR